MHPLLGNALLGKYRAIMLAVGCFLVFDLGVLLLNFYTSYEISADAVAINLSGRQRMLSQRMAKSALALDADLKAGEDGRAAAEELRGAVALFDGTLEAFISGGEVPGADGKPVVLKPVADAEGRRVLQEASIMWAPYKASLSAVTTGAPLPAIAEQAATAARTENARLLKLMNDLTVRLEVVAAAKAERLRLVQTIGIALALANFLFILFKFIRQLRASDERVEASRRETAEILATVQEGLFLIDRDFRIGSQASASLEKLLGRKVSPGDDFASMLKGMLKPEDHQMALDYARLLMGDRVKPALVRDLNPLREVAVETVQGVRHLSFDLNRVVVDGELSHLLVTVADVSAVVALRGEIDGLRSHAERQLGLLLQLMQLQPAVLSSFISDTEAALLDVNDRLRAVEGRTGEYRRLIDHVFRRVHGIKGNAASLDLDFVVSDCEVFEGVLAGLRGRDNFAGEELIGVSVHLQALFERTAWLRKIVSQFVNAPVAAASEREMSEALASLTQRIAGQYRKAVQTDIVLDELDGLAPQAASALRAIASQLVRNAVVHGIETPQERAAAGKAEQGRVKVALLPAGPSRYALSVRDDGRGLSAPRLREALRGSGRYTEEALASLSDKQVVMEIFRPGFTTADKADEHGGRGVGLDVVADAVRRIGGHLKLFTQPGQYTEFRVEFPGSVAPAGVAGMATA
ncbi:ATP-binding protein [Uliginosibacterium sp. H1]|uniref:ATP-binding protein n=1 Tax=Uliginosibacterium sp. H1 TaxID=3114757 RepID=UPI002E19B3D1|nr:ATP-binding protein [Uliginosibacterium sp. H1]